MISAAIAATREPAPTAALASSSSHVLGSHGVKPDEEQIRRSIQRGVTGVAKGESATAAVQSLLPAPPVALLHAHAFESHSLEPGLLSKELIMIHNLTQAAKRSAVKKESYASVWSKDEMDIF